MLCKIYTTGRNVTVESLLKLLEVTLQKVVDQAYIEDEKYSIYVDRNDEYNKELETDFPDGFLFFKLLIEIDFNDKIMHSSMINITNKILTTLWANNFPSVASCSYENELSQQGGYNSKITPWPHNL